MNANLSKGDLKDPSMEKEKLYEEPSDQWDSILHLISHIKKLCKNPKYC